MNNKKSWIKEKLVECYHDKSLVNKMYDDFVKETNAPWNFDSFVREVRRCYVELQEGEGIIDLSSDLIKEEARKQRLQDNNNVLRKTNRETYRLYNSLEDVYKEYVELLKATDLSKINIKPHKADSKNKVGILQLSDLHFNEVIYESESHNNSYDFVVASKRLKKFVSEAIKEFEHNNVKDCYVLFLGDMCNSNRRLSEKLAQNTSLVRASLLGTYLLQQVIIELSTKFNIHVASVVGNESRLDDFMDSSDILSSENWDYLIFNNLRLIFSNSPIKFIESNNNIEQVVSLKNGFNALITHGHLFKSSNTIEKNVANLLQKYIYAGIKIHGVFIGHYHSSSIGDFISRSGSLCGGNSYSNVDLMYLTRASQNIYIINDDLSYKGIKIDLQNVDNVKGYDIIEELERYNVPNKQYNNTVTIKNLV